MTFTVQRHCWRRGVDDDDTLLFDGDNYCVFGFYGLGMGLDDEQLIGAQGPMDLPYQNWPKWIRPENEKDFHSSAVEQIIKVNDDALLTDAEREAKLTELFAKHGDMVTFID